MSDSARIIRTNFTPNPTQRRFIESQAKADLFSSRRGEGKSSALCWSIFYHTRHNPGANWAVVRDTFENLQRTTMKTFFEWFPPGVYGTYHETKKVWTWAEGVGRGTVTFVGMDNASDATRFLSWELAGIALDEPAPATDSGGIDEMVFDLGMTCLRQPEMKWYCMKLAENNPDESHWSYRKFAGPEADDRFRLWQPPEPENIANLPAEYYENMRRSLAHRPDLVRRFVDGEFGFQSQGRSVTPQWSDKLHLATGLYPTPGKPLYLLWDFGHTPVCLVSQIVGDGTWNFLDTLAGDGVGIEELIEGEVAPLLMQRYGQRRYELKHIGDPQGKQREQTSIHRSPRKLLLNMLGGTWKDGPVRLPQRIEPSRSVLTKTVGGRGLVQVDRHRAKHIWWALRGGWHYPVSRSGIVGSSPVKDINSHPGDAFSYGAGALFPLGKLAREPDYGPGVRSPVHFQGKMQGGSLGFERPGLQMPEDGAIFGGG